MLNDAVGEVLEKEAEFGVLTLVLLPGRYDTFLSFGFLIYKTRVLLNDRSEAVLVVNQVAHSFILFSGTSMFHPPLWNRPKNPQRSNHKVETIDTTAHCFFLSSSKIV